MKKILAWVFILIGVIPIAINVILSAFDEGEFSIQVNDPQTYDFLSKNLDLIMVLGYFGGIILITAGILILRNEKMKRISGLAESDLEPGEYIVNKSTDFVCHVYITNTRVRYIGAMTKELRRSAVNLPITDKEDYLMSDIKSVKAVLASDVASNFLAKRNKSNWGIQLELKDGTIVNIPVKNHLIIAGQIEQFLNQRQY